MVRTRTDVPSYGFPWYIKRVGIPKGKVPPELPWLWRQTPEGLVALEPISDDEVPFWAKKESSRALVVLLSRSSRLPSGFILHEDTHSVEFWFPAPGEAP